MMLWSCDQKAPAVNIRRVTEYPSTSIRPGEILSTYFPIHQVNSSFNSISYTDREHSSQKRGISLELHFFPSNVTIFHVALFAYPSFACHSQLLGHRILCWNPTLNVVIIYQFLPIRYHLVVCHSMDPTKYIKEFNCFIIHF